MTSRLIIALITSVMTLSCGGPKKTDGPAQTTEKETADQAASPVETEGSDDIVATEVTYQVGEVTMKGYLAYDSKREGKRPGVLVVHEWWGHNDYARMRTRMLAAMGYTALAVDMYGDGKLAEHPTDAGKFAGEVMQNLDGAKARFTKAMEVLKGHETTDPEKIAAIGYCFGGGIVLHMARFGVELDGVVSFHGSLATNTPAQSGQVKAAVLVCHGAEDGFIKPGHITAFKQEMEGAGVDYTFESYEGAKHSFTSKAANEYGKKFGLPLAYDKAADEKSWQSMQDFFAKIFAD